MRKMFTRLFCLGAVVAALMAPVTAYAETEKEKAVSAYRNFLSQKTITWRDVDGKAMDSCYKMTMSSVKFAMVYLDGDSVPELVLSRTKKINSAHDHSDSSIAPWMIYTYKNNRVQYVCSISPVGQGSMFGYTKEFQYYPGTGIFQTSFPFGVELYKYRNGHAWKWLRHTSISSIAVRGESIAIIQGDTSKDISIECYNAQCEKYIGDCNMVTKAFCTNTELNRQKFIK